MTLSILHGTSGRITALCITAATIVALCSSMLSNPLSAQAQPDCVTCMPQRTNAHLAGTYKVCIQPGVFSPTQITAMDLGQKHWSNWLAAQGYTVTLNFSEEDTSHSDCQMKIYAMSMGAAAQSLSTSNGVGSEIRINENTLGRTDANYWNELLGHEFGTSSGSRT